MPSVTALSKISSGLDVKDKPTLLDTLNYVEPRKSRRVPNHILDTKVYAKICRNTYVEAQPSSIHFAGFEVGQKFSLSLDIANVSTDVLKMHIIPPQSNYFDLHYIKGDRLVPGLAIECTVDFFPNEWRYYYDCIRINCPGEENLVIPIHAYPVLDTSGFPTQIDFPLVPVGDVESRMCVLRSAYPVNFEFDIKITKFHPAFTIEPLSGSVYGIGETDISVTFSPTEYLTAHMVIQLQTSQFEAAPIICNISGASAPGLVKEISLRNYDATIDMSKPRAETPLERVRKKRLVNKPANLDLHPSKREMIEYKGIQFMVPLNCPYMVAHVLNQQEGKLSLKALQTAMNLEKKEGVITRQMKEAMFEKAVRLNAYNERQNQLRWQVNVGSDPMPANAKDAIIAHRHNSYQHYSHNKLGTPLESEEYERHKVQKLFTNTFRDASHIGQEDIQFDCLQNNLWNRRHHKLFKFRQAVHKVIIQNRVAKGLINLRPYLVRLRRGSLLQEKSPLSSYLNPSLLCSSGNEFCKLDKNRIAPCQFPTYAPSQIKDDMAPSSLGLVKTSPVEVSVKQPTSYFQLTVPQHYKTQGYKPIDVHEASKNYISIDFNRQFRTGAPEEKVLLPMMFGEESNMADPVDLKETVSIIPDETPHSKLIPPPAMFAPPVLPDLHIFNPCPGLQVFKAPQMYPETGVDYHLCPIPRYTRRDYATNYHAATQRKYLDREDIIRGVMTWKKFPSQGLTALTNLPSLTNVWVPRWNGVFSNDLLPTETPSLLTSLPQDDEKNMSDQTEENTELALTPEMVYAQFDLPETLNLIKTETRTNQEFPFSRHLPPNNAPSSTYGFVTRETRETDLEYFTASKMNRLGAKVQATMDHYNTLYTDASYVLK